MHEAFPLLAGVSIALVVHGIRTPRLKIAVLVAFSIIVGFAASVISAEVLISWGFWVIDFVEVLLAAIATLAILSWWRQPTNIR